jgi:hypothetical protein
VSTTSYEAPRVTFVGSDPKIPALQEGMMRVAVMAGPLGYVLCESQLMAGFSKHMRKCLPCRFVTLAHARQRRVDVLMQRVERANASR